jgi:hypothetical protein
MSRSSGGNKVLWKQLTTSMMASLSCQHAARQRVIQIDGPPAVGEYKNS